MSQRQSPPIKARIIFDLGDESKARALALSLQPDEKFKLEGLKIRTAQRGNSVVTYILCRRGARSMAETLDDLLRAVNLVLEVIEP